jgi:hypothetical protein
MSKRSERLAEALLADAHRETVRDERIIPCMSCGHTFVYRGRRGNLNGRFCSMRCQDWFDAGNPPISRSDPFSVALRDWKVIAGPPGIEVGSAYYVTVFGNRRLTDMRQSGDGFAIKCAGCSKEFTSRGLRCCSVECERSYKDREQNMATMAEVGMEPKAKRRCANPGCSNTIPTWRKGRNVSTATRFCSDRCSRQSKRTLAEAA